ncbi:MAG: hypothetical protein A2107_08610 [Verrucomicrobia bacterium GWF2_62_7]|nr:MAG: hypothetical protein A2107_08610 [Verrucomicrobia bacterium GWF2_62_7]
MSADAQTGLDRARAVAAAIPERGLFAGTEWRIAPRAFPISPVLAAKLETLGPQLLAFYRACNLLYRFSVRGTLPRWIADYLDAGKPPALIEASRHNRFKAVVPRIIRPDILLQDTGTAAATQFKITELDSVPGGIGLTAWLNHTYSTLGAAVIGGARGMQDGFRQILCAESPTAGAIAQIVVSEEAATYRPEMDWIARQVTTEQLRVSAITPEELSLGDDTRPDVVYRFFELFDMANVPNSTALLDAACAGKTAVTPPFKPQLEEKMLFAFFWHTALKSFWRQELGEKVFAALQQVIPYTWILDPTPLPPHAVIPELGIHDWREMARFSQKQRELVIKISGFDANAWGARSVTVGHDVSAAEWAAAIEHALGSFPSKPYILQRFHRSRVTETEWADLERNQLQPMRGRARLCPYYFVTGDDARLGGVLATVCPQDKKILHGMTDAIMVPCAVTSPPPSAA